MNTAQLTKMVLTKFAMPEYATFTNVSNGTGSNARRFSDAVAMSVWPSRGLCLTGMELKVSRSDWLRELKNPAKAESVFQYCDYWYVVAGDDKIVADGELPETWGLYVANGRGLKTVKQAPRLEAKQVSRSFLAAVLRRAKEQDVDTEAMKAEYDRGRNDEKSSNDAMNKRRERDHEHLQQTLRDFEEASGIRIDRWTYGTKKMGEIVKLLMGGDAINQMKVLAASSKRIAEVADEAVVMLGGNPVEAERNEG